MTAANVTSQPSFFSIFSIFLYAYPTTYLLVVLGTIP